MAFFKYEVISEEGIFKRGRIEALSPRNAAQILKNYNLCIVSIKEEKTFSNTLKNFFTLFPSSYPAIFCRQMAIMIGSGLTLHTALKVLVENNENNPHKKIVRNIFRTVDNGVPFSAALENEYPFFSKTTIAIIAAGEASGSLERVLNHLAINLEKKYSFQEKMLTLMSYPIILFICMLSAFFFVLNFVLPTFADLFKNFQTPLPWPTRVILKVTSFCQDYYLYIFILGIILLFALFSICKKKQARFLIDKNIFKIPLLGAFFLKIELFNLCSTLSLLLSSGIVIDKSFDILQNVSNNLFIKKVLLKTKINIEQGYPLSVAISQTKIFPPLFLEIISSGEATGNIDYSLEKISEICHQDTTTFIERIQPLIEPIMIILLSFPITLLVAAIFLPFLDTIFIFS